MNIEYLTIGQAKEITKLLGATAETKPQNPFLGQFVLCRTYSAGVHVGTLKAQNGREVHLEDSIRIWKWTDGGLSLSAIANEGQKGGRNNRTGSVFLTEVIEIIRVTDKAKESYERFVE